MGASAAAPPPQPRAVPTDLCQTTPPAAWQRCASTSCWWPWSRRGWPLRPHVPTPPLSSSGRPDGAEAAWCWTSSLSMVMPPPVEPACPSCSLDPLPASPQHPTLLSCPAFGLPWGQQPLPAGAKAAVSHSRSPPWSRRRVLLGRGGVLDYGGAVCRVDSAQQVRGLGRRAQPALGVVPPSTSCSCPSPGPQPVPAKGGRSGASGQGPDEIGSRSGDDTYGPGSN